ncbi:MAG: hypothetical protein ACOYL3_05140 [Desulfuromonadaceae bacterium]
MKKTRRNKLVAGSVLALLVAAGVTESNAAAAAPVLTVINTKVADGSGYTDGGPSFVTDGQNIYSALKAADGVIKIVKSTNGGALWGGAHRIAVPAGGVDKITLAISGDAAFPTQKIIHVVWEMDTPDGRDIMYTWADAANLDAWSEPVRVNGSMLNLQDPVIAVTKTGKIYIKGQLDDKYYLMTSTAHDANYFEQPVMIPLSASFSNPGSDSEIFFDGANNLHLSFPYCSNADCSTMGMKYTRMSAAGVWSNPSTIVTTGGGHSGIAAYDANNVCIATIGGNNLAAYCTTNGGSTWLKKTIASKTSTQSYGSYVDVAVNSSKVFTIGSNLHVSDAVKSTVLYRTNDGGVSWSQAASFPAAGSGYIALGVDGSGKLGVYTMRENVDGESAIYFTKEK